MVTKGQYILVYVPKYKKDILVHFLIKKLVVPKGLPFGTDEKDEKTQKCLKL